MHLPEMQKIFCYNIFLWWQIKTIQCPCKFKYQIYINLPKNKHVPSLSLMQVITLLKILSLDRFFSYFLCKYTFCQLQNDCLWFITLEISLISHYSVSSCSHNLIAFVLTFFYRFLVEIFPKGGSKVERKMKGKIHTSVHPRVLKLYKNMFDMNGKWM